MTSHATSKPSIFLHFFASVDLYYFGMVDASHSMGRRCPGSASLCPYRLRVWSGQCAHCVVCVQALSSTMSVYWIHHTAWVVVVPARRHIATTHYVCGPVSVSTGMSTLTTGLLQAASSMSHPRLISLSAGTAHCFLAFNSTLYM